MVFYHHNPCSAGTTVKTMGTKGKRKRDEGNGIDDAEHEVGRSKKAKVNDPKAKKKEIDREYQRDCRVKANEKREKMWQLAGVTAGTLEKKDDARKPSYRTSLIV